MHVHGLGLTTDLGIAALSGRIRDRGDYLVVTSPDEPHYYFGNYLVLPGPPAAGEVAYWTRKFADEIGTDPRIRHVTLLWDGVNGEVGAADELAAAGFTVEHHWVMTATSPRGPVLGNRFEVRPLGVDDMAAVAALDFAIGDRHDEVYRQFLQRRCETKKRLVERGLAQWWGAFDVAIDSSRPLVGSLGIVPLAGVARYQDVQTAATHRRRGIAAALLAAAGQAHDKLLIVAEPNSAAARVYERAGFSIAERTASACRYPPA